MPKTYAPHPAENDKFVKWVKQCKEENDEEAFQHIVDALHGYLQHLSLKKFYHIPGNSSDDVYQEGLLALSTKAIPDYREEKGAFLSFAKLCIKRHIITILKASNNYKNKMLNDAISLEGPSDKQEDDTQVPVSGVLPSDDEDIVELLGRIESHTIMKNALLRKLTPMEAEVLGHYLKGMSYIEIVTAMNITRRGKNRVNSKSCDNGLERIKKKSKKILEEFSRNKRK